MAKLKSFMMHGTEFRPCEWQDSKAAGSKWYAVTLHPLTNMEYSEQHSPRFATKEDCRLFALDRAEADAAEEMASL
jgi:hypothetical protein